MKLSEKILKKIDLIVQEKADYSDILDDLLKIDELEKNQIEWHNFNGNYPDNNSEYLVMLNDGSIDIDYIYPMANGDRMFINNDGKIKAFAKMPKY